MSNLYPAANAYAAVNEFPVSDRRESARINTEASAMLWTLWTLSGIALAACGGGGNSAGKGGGNTGITTGFLLDATGSNDDDGTAAPGTRIDPNNDNRYFAIFTPQGHQVSTPDDLRNLFSASISTDTDGTRSLNLVIQDGTSFSANGNTTVGFCDDRGDFNFDCSGVFDNSVKYSVPTRSGDHRAYIYVDIPASGTADLKSFLSRSSIPTHYYLGEVVFRADETYYFTPNMAEQPPSPGGGGGGGGGNTITRTIAGIDFTFDPNVITNWETLDLGIAYGRPNRNAVYDQKEQANGFLQIFYSSTNDSENMEAGFGDFEYRSAFIHSWNEAFNNGKQDTLDGIYATLASGASPDEFAIITDGSGLDGVTNDLGTSEIRPGRTERPNFSGANTFPTTTTEQGKWRVLLRDFLLNDNGGGETATLNSPPPDDNRIGTIENPPDNLRPTDDSDFVADDDSPPPDII